MITTKLRSRDRLRSLLTRRLTSTDLDVLINSQGPGSLGRFIHRHLEKVDWVAPAVLVAAPRISLQVEEIEPLIRADILEVFACKVENFNTPTRLVFKR